MGLPPGGGGGKGSDSGWRACAAYVAVEKTGALDDIYVSSDKKPSR